MSFGVRPIGLAGASAPPTIVLGFENTEHVFMLSSRFSTPSRESIMTIGDNGSMGYHLSIGIPPAYWYQGPAGWSNLFEARVVGNVDSQAAGGTIQLLGQPVTMTFWDTGFVPLNSSMELHAYATTPGASITFSGTLYIRRISNPAEQVSMTFTFETNYTD